MPQAIEQPAIFSATLGLSHPWQITSVTFAKDGRRMDITIDIVQGSPLPCPCCGKAAKTRDTQLETWQHNNFFRFDAYLHANVPHIDCACCGKQQIERPWARAGSKFALVD
jgi:transposase